MDTGMLSAHFIISIVLAILFLLAIKALLNNKPAPPPSPSEEEEDRKRLESVKAGLRHMPERRISGSSSQ